MLAAQSSGGGSFLPLLMIVLLFGVMYFMMIRPQQKRRREAQQMQSTLGPGAEVVTIGGLHATVVEADAETVTLEAAPGVQMRYARPAIARVIKNDVPEPAAAPAVETITSPVEPAKD
ncbi:preprotein translocase subunit YajC [Asanoa iriomotensis]|uniref:Preprotein translocase subunit YajC n=1 Tax=Asanoa iriomotensis TaxID=234613 RepID=A0ABQ4CFX8_9ACTN|nr:preprotein translocase subunit YajC [Asanoa iriomotensis]GIF61672.1 preprotein translocase subunit YajC [Asanoa iriomotensis]